MEIIITFFRDILDGPLYIVVAVLCSILICSCIGYMGEQYLNKKKKQKEFKENYIDISNTSTMAQSGGTPVSMAQSSVSTIGEVASVTATASPVVGSASTGYSSDVNQNGNQVNNMPQSQ